MTTNDATWCRQ